MAWLSPSTRESSTSVCRAAGERSWASAGEVVASYAGSISAEHGLGAMKTEEALLYKSPVEVEALRAIRRALDPNRIMNPRVLF